MFCYKTSRLEYLKGLLTLDGYCTALSSIAMEKYLTDHSSTHNEVQQTRKDFREALETAKAKCLEEGISQEASFEEPYVFLLPDPEHACMRHGFIWVLSQKSDLSIIVSPFPMPWLENL